MNEIKTYADDRGATVIEVGDRKVTVRPRYMRDGMQSYHKNTRVFGAIDALADADLQAEFDRWVPPQAPAVVKTDTDPESVRVIKGYEKARRALARDVKIKLNDLLLEISHVLDDGHRAVQVQNFSIKAGCSCPCSPGFILEATIRHDGKPVDLWID